MKECTGSDRMFSVTGRRWDDHRQARTISHFFLDIFETFLCWFYYKAWIRHFCTFCVLVLLQGLNFCGQFSSPGLTGITYNVPFLEEHKIKMTNGRYFKDLSNPLRWNWFWSAIISGSITRIVWESFHSLQATCSRKCVYGWQRPCFEIVAKNSISGSWPATVMTMTLDITIILAVTINPPKTSGSFSLLQCFKLIRILFNILDQISVDIYFCHRSSILYFLSSQVWTLRVARYGFRL